MERMASLLPPMTLNFFLRFYGQREDVVVSLTSNLNQGDSDIRQFFAINLPKLSTTSRELNKELAGRELKADSSRLTPYEKTIAGGVIDYRTRMLFDFDYDAWLVRRGAIVMGEPWSRENGIYDKLLAYRSDTTDERRLCQISIVFSYLDGCSRSGMESMALKEIGSKKIEQMLDALSPALIDDVTAQSRLVRRQSFVTNSKNFVLAPTFDGSIDVGGADADLIVDGVLIDFKSTAKCKLTSAILRQLIGYWLLDYSDRYAVKRVGVFFHRYGALWTMDVAGLLFLCGFESERGLRDLWNDDRRRRSDQTQIVESFRLRPIQTKEEVREKRKLSLAKRQWRLAGAGAVLANPEKLKKWQLAIIRKFASGKTDYACMSGSERTLLDEQSTRALMPFDDWYSQPKKT
jgi:hypothetical protein